MQPLIIYTCVTNGYDWMLPPIWQSPKAHYICFTDDPNLKVKGWEVRNIAGSDSTHESVLANRYHKFFPWNVLPKHEWSIYIDANIRLLRDPTPIISKTEKESKKIALPLHPERKNIWEEAEAIKAMGKAPRSEFALMDEQLDHYHREGYSDLTGLTANWIIFRTGYHPSLMSAMADWWDELNNGVRRDQLSLQYVLWKNNVEAYKVPLKRLHEDQYFRRVPHKVKGSLNNYVSVRRYHSSVWYVADKILVLAGRFKKLLKKF